MVNEIDREGRSALHYAALDNNIDETARRIANGDNVNLGDNLGFTPLHLAAQSGAMGVASDLLSHGAVVDSVNRFGNTPLFVAVFNSRGRGEMIRLLREHGADPVKPNNSNQTPLGLARLINNYDVACFFADIEQ